jgi:GTP cyclohydrolase I
MDKLEQLKYHYQEILKLIGEDVGREGLLKTPERAAKAILSLTKGYEMNAREILESAIFSEDIQNMVVVKDVEFYSLCEHHILPFFGKAHIAYIPNGKIVGLSKIPRIVDVFSKRRSKIYWFLRNYGSYILLALFALGVVADFTGVTHLDILGNVIYYVVGLIEKPITLFWGLIFNG